MGERFAAREGSYKYKVNIYRQEKWNSAISDVNRRMRTDNFFGYHSVGYHPT